MKWYLGALALWAMSSMGWADEPQRLSEAEHLAWQAIGRINQAGFDSKSLCTATLIAPDLILTAAHCFDLSRYDAPVFVAGYYKGRFAAVRKVVGIEASGQLDRAAPLSLAAIAQDWAILRLETAITEVPPLPHTRPRLGLPLDVISYSGKTAHALSTRTQCATSRAAHNVITLNCPAEPGNSGGPALMQTPEGWAVVAVVSAATSRGRSLAVIPNGFPSKN